MATEIAKKLVTLEDLKAVTDLITEGSIIVDSVPTITDEEGLEIIDNMATLIISGREAGTLAEAEGVQLIDEIFA